MAPSKGYPKSQTGTVAGHIEIKVITRRNKMKAIDKRKIIACAAAVAVTGGIFASTAAFSNAMTLDKAKSLAKEHVPMAVGPTLTNASKYELRNKSWVTPGVLAAAGCQVSIITDAPVIPEHYLPLCAGMAVKAGMDPFQALQAITINPAKHIGLEDRVGSLEEGKDADIVVTDGCPFEVATEVRYVLIDGNVVKE